jgi:AraC-like DNA-binding protein
MTEYTLLSGVIISAFLSLILIVKKNKSAAEYILLLWIFTSGYVTFSYLMVHNGWYIQYPALTVSGLTIPLLPGPFMYLYIKYQTRPIFFDKKDLLHFLPFVVCNLMFTRFYLLPFDEQVQALSSGGEDFETECQTKTYLTFLSGIVYCIWSFTSLYAHKKNLKKTFSNLEGIHFNWLLALNIGLLLLWTVILSTRNDDIIFSAAAVYIIFIGFFGITQSNVFSEREVHRFQLPPHTPEPETPEIAAEAESVRKTKQHTAEQEVVYQKTIDLLKKEKLYLNPELKLLDLALPLNLHPNLISKAINSVSGCHFYDLVNTLRVETFMEKVQGGATDQFTILSVAYDSGFNSKASFNRNFKSITGLSPSEFLKSRVKNDSFVIVETTTSF